MKIPSDCRFTQDHEWVKVDGNIAIVGITEFAQSELGEIVFVEVDTVDEEVSAGDVFGTIEAVKTTSDLFMPVSGRILEFNPLIDENEGDNPGIINEDPYGDGWIVKVEMSDPSELDNLLDPKSYEELIG
jgi:glycine cleavage system H protein